MKCCLACGVALSGDGWRCAACGHAPLERSGFLCFAPEELADEEAFPSVGFGQLARAEDGHFWFRARRKLLTWALDRFLPAARSFLEVGCGNAFVLDGLRQARPGLRVVGSELHLTALPLARARLGDHGTLLQMSACAMPFVDEFDAVGAFDVIEHIDDDEAALDGMVRALRPGGGLMLTVPQHDWLWTPVDEYSGHKRRYSRAELVGKLEAAGVVVEMATSFVSFLLPAMVLSRWLSGGQQVADVDPEKELQISPVVNAVLEAVCALERWCIQAGVRWPLGGSLLVVARKPA